MSAFELYTITAVAFGLSAPAAALHAAAHFFWCEFWRSAAWATLTVTYGVLAFAYATRAMGAA